MGLRECLSKFHLLILASLVVVSLVLICVGGSIEGWCTKERNGFHCHSLFYSKQKFSCLFKLLPTAIVFFLIISLAMFVLLMAIQFYTKCSGFTQKEYRLVARLVNVVALSVAVVLIMVVLLLWIHPLPHSCNSILVAKLLDKGNGTRAEDIEVVRITPDHPLYLSACEIRRQAKIVRRQSINHGPNLFFTAFIVLFLILLGFVSSHRIEV